MKKRTVIGISAAVCCIAAAVIFLQVYKPAPVFGFYRIPARTKTALQKYMQNTKCRFTDLDETVPLAEQQKLLKKIDILFTVDGIEAAELPLFAAEKIPGLSALPSPVRVAGTIKKDTGTGRYGLPLLIDHLEIAFNKNIFNKAGGIPYPLSLDALTAAAASQKNAVQSPVTVAAGDDRILLALTGAVAEALFGGSFTAKLAEQLAANPAITESDQAFAEFSKRPVAAVNKTNVSFDDVLSFLAGWELQGILHSRWSSMSDADLAALMETQQAAVAILPFARHRTLPAGTVENYEILFMPGNNRTEMRQLVMPVTVACTPRGKRTNTAALDIVYSMITAEGQDMLGMMSGLAPVHSTAEAADIQASDLRFWCAASLRVAPPLGRAVCRGSAQETALAQAIRSRTAALKMDLIAKQQTVAD